MNAPERTPRPERRHTVLVIDDERQTVTAVKHLFRRRYNVLGATRAQEGLDLIDQHDVSVILCDQRMPGMTGAEFFEAVRQKNPDAVRILITAYSDIQALVRSVNRGQIFAYLAKPWNPEELEQAVDTAIAHRELLDDKRRMTAELAEKNAELRRMNQELRNFTHVVAHDLKEPLRTISAYVGFLNSDHPEVTTGEPGAYISSIDRCARHLHDLINALLQFAELEHVQTERKPVDLGRLVTQARELLEGAITSTGAVITVHDTLPVVLGNPSRLLMLLQNLISNGIKFNENRPPRIDIGLGPSAPPGMIELYVRDNGIGISPEYQTQIFQIFERLHSRTEYPGTGAGLAIVQRIVESHGGTIRVESDDGKGATFAVTLQLAPG
ncbi:MAG: response regulator [Myxococcales bacterium]|nr:response regulator [Myxococcales bacterium]